MLRSKRILSLALVFTLLFSLVLNSVALAQDATPPAYCAEVGLSADDCTLLVTSQEAMQNISSVTSYAELDFNISGIPDVPFETLDINYVQDSAVTQGLVAVTLAQELRGMTPQQRFQRFMDPNALTEILGTTVSDTNIDTELTLTVSEEIRAMIEAEAGLPVPNTLTFGIRIVDGIEYLNLSDFATMVPELAMFGGSWIGIEILPLIDAAYGEGGTLEQQMGAEGRLLMAQVMSSSAIWNSSNTLIHTLGTTPEAAMALPFFNVERLEDDIVNGNDVAVFRTTVDWTTLLNDPQVQELIKFALSDPELIGQEFSEAEIEQIMTAVQLFGPAVLQSLTLELIETVGLVNGYVYSGELTFDWDLSQLAALAAASGAEMGDSVPTIFINFLTTRDNFNEELTIEAPANAFILPPELLQQ